MSGTVNTQDSIVLMNELPKHADFDPNYKILIDSTKVNRAPELKDMRALASTVKNLTEHYKGNIALVVNPQHVHQSSIFALLVRPFGIRFEVYGDIESAEKFFSTGKSWI